MCKNAAVKNKENLFEKVDRMISLRGTWWPPINSPI